MAALAGFSRLFSYAASNCLRRIPPSSVFKPNYAALRVPETTVAGYYSRPPWLDDDKTAYQVEVPQYDEEKEKVTSDVIKEINKQIQTDTTGRLFAVVHLCGKQFKVTESDIIIVQGFWPPNPGDELKLEKVLLVGCNDFTLIGKPILNRELVSVDATVIEKTLSHTKTHFRMRRRKQYRRINFYRVQHTMLRINSININGDIDKRKEVEGLDRVY